MSLTVGSTIGPYRLEQHLGEGSLASVFKGFHAALDRFVTLKILRPELRGNAAALARFQHGARQVARLDHPNIIPVHDFAEYDGQVCLVLKFVEGETLQHQLMGGPLVPADCARMLGAVGAALQHAHDHGVVHGDLKPSNILLATDGNVYVTDFGVARLDTGDLGHTAPNYVSPEQVRETASLDGRSDQYSLGVVLFEALTGVVPFRGADAQGILQQHLLLLPPRPSALNPSLTRPIEEVVLKALSKDPTQRYPDVAALAAAFQRATAPPRPRTAPLRASDGSQFRSRTADLGGDPAAGSVSIMLSLVGGQVFRLTGKSEYSLGRSEPSRSFQPDVDLADWKGMEQGVSRLHGRLHFDSGRLYYTDLKSTNGSRVNGARLYAEIPMALEDGDEICVGKMVFRIYFGA